MHVDDGEISMEPCRLQTTLTQDSTLVLQGLPFKAGETVEVVIRRPAADLSEEGHYELRGLPVTFLDPTEPVAQSDWEAAR
jgi:hypothetical protein